MAIVGNSLIQSIEEALVVAKCEHEPIMLDKEGTKWQCKICKATFHNTQSIYKECD